jgi:hypothetical protein
MIILIFQMTKIMIFEKQIILKKEHKLDLCKYSFINLLNIFITTNQTIN